MSLGILPQSFSSPLTVAEIARSTDLSWVTVRNVLAGQGTIASLDPIRDNPALRWCWTSSTAAQAVARDLARRRKSKGLSQRDMAFRLAVSPTDDLAFERIVNVPKRGLGDTTVNMLTATARHQNIPLLASTRMMVETEDLKPKQRSTLRSLVTQFDDWSYRSQTLPPYQLVEQILEEVGA